MSFDLGKKITVGGFVLITILSIVQSAYNVIYITNSLHNGIMMNTNLVQTISLLITIVTIATLGGFALMWFTSGKIAYLAIGISMILGAFIPSFFEKFIGSLALLSIISLISTGLYMFIWALSRFSDNIIIAAALAASPFISIISLSISDFLIVGVGLNTTITIILVTIPLTLVAGGIKVFAAYTESEK